MPWKQHWLWGGKRQAATRRVETRSEGQHHCRKAACTLPVTQTQPLPVAEYHLQWSIIMLLKLCHFWFQNVSLAKNTLATNKNINHAKPWGEKGILFVPAVFYDGGKYCASPYRALFLYFRKLFLWVYECIRICVCDSVDTCIPQHIWGARGQLEELALPTLCGARGLNSGHCSFTESSLFYRATSLQKSDLSSNLILHNH